MAWVAASLMRFVDQAYPGLRPTRGSGRPGIRPARDQAGPGSGRPGIRPARGSRVAGRAGALTQRGAQQGFRGIGSRTRGDCASMGAIQLTKLDAVKGDPGIMDRELQLPGCLIDMQLTGVCPGNAHRPPSLPGTPDRGPVLVIQVPRMIAAMHARRLARHATYHKASGPTARGGA